MGRHADANSVQSWFLNSRRRIPDSEHRVSLASCSSTASSTSSSPSSFTSFQKGRARKRFDERREVITFARDKRQGWEGETSTCGTSPDGRCVGKESKCKAAGHEKRKRRRNAAWDGRKSTTKRLKPWEESEEEDQDGEDSIPAISLEVRRCTSCN